MFGRLFKKEHTSNNFININTSLCVACWECIGNCKKNVFEKIDLPWHKHIIMARGEDCTGCLRCTNVCKQNAITKKERTEGKVEAKKRSTIIEKLYKHINLIISGAATIITGFILQFGYHIGTPRHRGSGYFSSMSEKNVLGLNYGEWGTAHKAAILFFLAFCIQHIIKHFKFYKTVMRKRLYSKNKLITWVTITFVITALTGIIPWIIDGASGSYFLRKVFIETHDKVAIVFSLTMIMHIIKRVFV